MPIRPLAKLKYKRLREAHNLTVKEISKKKPQVIEAFLSKEGKYLLLLRSAELKIHYCFPRFNSNVLR